MSQGKRYDQKVRQKVLTLRCTGMSVDDVSERTGVSASTIRAWEKDSIKSDPDELQKLRMEKKAAFASRAFGDCEAALRMLTRQLQIITEHQETLEEILFWLEEMTGTEMDLCNLDKDGRRELIRKLKRIQVDDMGKLATVMGVLYDKSALAAGEATQNMGGSLTVKGFQDL